MGWRIYRVELLSGHHTRGEGGWCKARKARKAKKSAGAANWGIFPIKDFSDFSRLSPGLAHVLS
jgi:hypothetical protein